MIICSTGGARPAQDALKSFMAMKNRHAVVIRDGKVYHKQGVTQEYLDALVDSKYSYCLSERFIRNEIKIKDAWNPSLVCVAKDGQHYVGVSGGKMQPFGESFVIENGVTYSDTKWKPCPVLALVKSPSSIMNVYLRETLQLLTNEYQGCTGYTWDATKGRWINTYSSGEYTPYGYACKVYVGKTGGWVINKQALDVDFDELIPGSTRGGDIKKIKKYVVSYIKTLKADATVAKGFTYYDAEYYKAELQGVYIVYGACRLLAENRKKICRANLTKILNEITYGWERTGANVCRPEDYYEVHVAELDDML